MMQVKRLTQSASMPVRGSIDAAGFDLSSAYDLVVPKKGKAIVKTDIAIAIPHNTYARIAPRSGLAVKKFIGVGAGVVDYDYRGNVGVVLFNHGEEDFVVQRGDRVAQLVLERISMAGAKETDELPSSDRGTAGFGSTGVSTDAAKALVTGPCDSVENGESVMVANGGLVAREGSKENAHPSATALAADPAEDGRGEAAKRSRIEEV